MTSRGLRTATLSGRHRVTGVLVVDRGGMANLPIAADTATANQHIAFCLEIN
jgi:hypothetical protein